jgi:pantetheine-phosphate adenylyltransferase
MRTALYPGTFDPLTYGHMDIIERASAMFERVIITVAKNPKKSPMFTSDERVMMIRESIKPWTNVTCESFDGLIVDFAKSREALVLIRGLRVLSDFENELQMAHVNRRLAHDIVTVFMMPGEKYTYLNSGIVKEVASFGGDIQSFVTPAIAELVQKKITGK